MAQLKIDVTSSDHRLGPDDAPVTLVEYGDYQCPGCGAAHRIVPRIRARFGPELRFVFRNFPLTTLHPQALRAAEVAEFAGTRNRFWEMHDLLLENQERLGDALFANLAEHLGLPLDEMARELAARTHVSRIRDDFRGGVASGVNGTPTFFINGVRFDGQVDEVNLVEALAQELLPAR
jgi:protein-disulfide isomerase